VTPEQRYATVVAALTANPSVTARERKAGFGAKALRTRGKIFAMLVRGELVVKLPQGRVDDLVAREAGTRFDANKGRPMKEWVRVGSDPGIDWTALATEALAYVADVRG
jgi:hypothetical protein